MAARKINRRIRRQHDGVNVVADIQAVIASDTEPGTQRASASTRQRIVQRAGRAKGRDMSADAQPQGLSAEELEAQAGEALPDREAMSLIDANIAAPVNAAVAANVLSDGSTAYANAVQDATIDQAT